MAIASGRSGRWRRREKGSGSQRFLVQVLVLASTLAACDGAEPAATAGSEPFGAKTPTVATPAAGAFVTSAACGRCHAVEHAKWSGSHHDRAMEPASEDSVLGDFDDATFGQFPVLTRFFKRDGAFFVHTEGPDGELADFPVKYTFGVHPLQQYLIEFPNGRLQSFTIAWDAERRRWFDLYPDERIPPDDALHWTGRHQRWNTMCADCHSTKLARGYDLASDGYETTWSELDVGCEACHGAGGAHVAWAEAGGRGDDPGLPSDLVHGSATSEVESCAPCHSRRHKLTEVAEIGAAFLDGYMPETLREGLYHADGQVDGEVYVYGSFVQSRMHQLGVRCSDCHEPHALTLRAEGNALCVRCHSPEPDARFPSLTAKAYDTPEHHHHPAGSAGAQCVGCHMPEKTFMQIDARHDHSLRVPRPDLSALVGTPNACNVCHTDQTPEWAAERVADWYGEERRKGFHYGAVFAGARLGYRELVPALAAIAGDPELAPIVRATALELLERYPPGPETLGSISNATRDADPWVRAAAAAGLDRLPIEQRLVVLRDLLDDPVRAVRIVAGRLLAGAPETGLDPDERRALRRAVGEFEAAQHAVADTAGAHLNLGVLYTQKNEAERARAAYETAIALEPDFLPAYFNLASLFNSTGRNREAERVLRDAIEREPEQGELYYSLGLVLAEEERVEEAAETLARAAALMPDRARVRYNHALALQHLGRRAEAESELQAALAIDGGDAAIVSALAIFYLQDQRFEQAKSHARRLVELAPPGAPGPAQLLERIESDERAAAGGAGR